VDFRELQYILAVAEERSFSKAAKKLYLAQPSLSQYILKVEQQLGSSLFDRTIKPLRLTDAGELYVDTAKRILDLKDKLAQQMEDLADLKIGHLTIGISPFRSTYMLPSILPAFKQEFPGIEVRLAEGTMSELEDFAIKGITSFSIMTLPIPEDIFVYEPLMTEEIVIALPPNHPLGRAAKTTAHEHLTLPRIRLADLREEPFIVLKPGQRMRQVTLSLCQQAGFKPLIIMETKSMDAAHALVAAGIGVTLMPNTMLWFDKLSKCPVYFSMEDPVPTRILVVAYRKGAYLSKAAHAFVVVMKEVLDQMKHKHDKGTRI